MRRNIFNLALDFYQSPAEHRDLLDPSTPLPQDVSSLLDALTENKDPRSEQPVELPDDLRAAIQFLIERVFFAPGADCYRILGLNYGAKPDEIRKHYNQLLHVFALDRVDRSDEWNAAYATQINRAYSVLRDPERRLAYDQTLLQAGGARAPAGQPRDGRVGAEAEVGKAPRKVSYLNPGQIPGAAPSPRALAPEQEIQELQRQLQKGAREAAATAGPVERSERAPEPAPRSSFIANRIDRASGIAEPAGFEPDVHEHFPKGIPVTVPEADESRGRRGFAMDKASFAVMAAVVLVLIVYAIVLPNRFQGDASGPALDAGGEPPVEAANGNIVRDETDSGAAGMAAPESVAPAPQSAGQGGVSTATAAGGETPAPSAPVTAGSAVTAPPAASTSVETGRAGMAADARKSAKTEAATASRPEPVAPGATAGGTQPATPAKKLESMRQTMQADASPAPQDTARPAAAGTRSQEQPVSAPPAPTRPPVSAAPAVAAPVQNGGITIQELDRLGETFSRAYEAGDLARLVGLFAADARTNDQSSRAGIEQDYRELFQLSERRTFTFGRLRWEQDKNGDGLKGEGDFRAEVQLKGESSVTTVTGKVVFHVRRAPGGIVITEMLHSYN